MEVNGMDFMRNGFQVKDTHLLRSFAYSEPEKIPLVTDCVESVAMDPPEKDILLSSGNGITPKAQNLAIEFRRQWEGIRRHGQVDMLKLDRCEGRCCECHL